MPCISEGPGPREIEAAKVEEFLKEISGVKFNHERVSLYGNVARLDENTATLCAFLKPLRSVKRFSLELQLWWQRHQKADAERAAREANERLRRNLKRRALAKLTPAERAALKGEML